VELGDGRLSLAKAPSHKYNLIVLDAFSSDVIPMHLLTREAIELYFEKLRENGVLALHISNRYFDLEPVCAGTANSLGVAARSQFYNVTSSNQHNMALSSNWVVMARHGEDFGSLRNDPRWVELNREGRSQILWTDDYSNLWAVLRK
jgi:spermidine synthase